MKRSVYIIILSVAILSLVLSACAVPKEPSSQTEPSPAGTSAKAETFLEDTATQTEPETEASVEAEILCSNEKYTISLTGEKCYINFANGNNASPSEGYSQVGSIDFSSLSEMKQAFLQNNLTEQQIQTLRTAFASYSYGNENGIEICNLTSLYHAVYPQEIQASKVTLVGENYYFSTFDSADFSSTVTHVPTQTKYEQYYASKFNIAETSPYVTITNQADGLFDGINCKIIEYEYPNSGAKCRDHIFDIDNHGISYHVNVRYRLKSPSAVNWRESETLPSEVWMFWQQDGQYFFIEIDDLNIEPTVEWLTSFGVTPYVDNSDHVAS